MKTTVLFLSGMFATRELWLHQVRELEGLGIETIYYEVKGATDVTEVAGQALNVLPEKFSVVALSLGGHVAFAMLKQVPERIERLALLNTSAYPDLPDQQALRRQVIRMVQAGDYPALVEKLLPMAVYQGPGSDPTILNRARRMALQLDPEIMVSRAMMMQSRPDARSLVREIECPSVVIAGEQDKAVPLEQVTEMAESIPDCKYYCLQHCGHLSPMERPQEVTDILLDFIGLS